MKKQDEVENALKQPLPEDEIRKRADGQEFVSIGDVLLNLRDDVGPLNYDWTIEDIKYHEPREDKRQKVDKRTGAASGPEELGWTAFAYCMGKLTVRFTDADMTSRVCVRMGVGTASSDMQPYPEMALENALKAAESDALKRAVVGLGPRYGLALRFDAKRGDDRRELGMTAPDPAKEAALERARAVRDAAKNKAQAGANLDTKPTQAPAAGKAPAATTNQTSGARTAQSPRTGAAPEVASKPDPAAAEKKAALDAALKANAPGATRTVEQALASGETLTGDEATLARAAIAEAVKASKPDPSPPPSGATSPAGSSNGSSQSTDTIAPVSSSESASTTSEQSEQVDPEKAAATSGGRRTAIQACMRGEVPAWVTERLLVGVQPSDALGGAELPPDPTVDDLMEAAWSVPGASPADLCALGLAEPLATPMVKALVDGAVARLGGDRKQVGRLWKAYALGGKDAPSYGYHARLFAWTVGHLSRNLVSA